MIDISDSRISRRHLLQAGAGALVMISPPVAPLFASGSREFRLTALRAEAGLVGGGHASTAVWSYNGTVPGPEIRVRQGDRVRIMIENRLEEETTVHWHGVRVPNAMDGVPHLTQKPIAPGETFAYEFDVPDAGTFWYHPHQRSAVQVGRGLYGAFIVEERQPISVDRDVVWVVDDWRLKTDAQISDDFLNLMDISHNGRLGNTVTVNGRVPQSFAVRSGERIRFRLVNAANARIFGLGFEGHRPIVVAYDGQPVEPHLPPGDRIVLGPAMRADVVLDLTGKPGERFAIVDTYYRGLEYRLADLEYDAAPLRDRVPDAPIALPANALPEPDIAAADRHEVILGGGMMGGMATATMDGRPVDMREMMRHGKAWAINGIAATGHAPTPFLRLKRGRPCLLAIRNETAWPHPMHLHGHSFRVTSRNGQPTRHREWQDTVLVTARESAEVAFVADNPGDWMFHCHVLEHQEAGMMGVIRVE